MCHRVLARYIIQLYCLAVQAGFYSDVVECSTLDQRVPGSILTRGMEIFNESITGVSGLGSIIPKTWACQNPDQSFTRLGHIKTPINHRKSLACIRTPINHSQNLGISIKTRSVIRKTWIYQDSDQSFTRLWHIKTLSNHLQGLGISKHMPIMSWICQSCQ